MRRIVLLLLFCLPLHGFAMQGGLPPVAGAAWLVHEFGHQRGHQRGHHLEHDQGISHHHHEEDGSVHYDDSDESRDHAQEHSSSSQPAGFGLPRLTLPPEQSAPEPGAYVARPVPEPFLGGPHRPPASAPGHAAGGSRHT